MNLLDHLTQAVQAGASDLFLVPGAPVSIKLDGRLQPLDAEKLLPSQAQTLLEEMYAMAERDMNPFKACGDDDFSFAVAGLARFRVNAYRQRGSLAAVVRVVAFRIPDWRELGIGENIMELAQLRAGMVLITGTAGSGKSTTLACLVDRINRQRACHIITLEDPIEYLHRNRQSIVS